MANGHKRSLRWREMGASSAILKSEIGAILSQKSILMSLWNVLTA